ncbi:amidohydrolase family protein [Candidatus Micrarchaeota archaeon]|nr:amidohydrolase family protein [Candidatus Micrarchaeota archaeon]
MVQMDCHVHFAKPEHDENVAAERDDSPWNNSDYRGKTLAEFIAERSEYQGNSIIDMIVQKLRGIKFPALPHVVEKIYRAIMDPECPQKLVVLAMDYPGSTQPTHEEMLRLVEAFPDIITGTVSVNPNGKDAAVILERRLKELIELNGKLGNGWRPGVKFHPLAQNFDPGDLKAMERLYRIMDETGAVIVTHTGVFQRIIVERDIELADPMRFREVAERYHRLNIVLSHMGTPDIVVTNWWAAQGVEVRHFQNALDMVMRFPNVYGDMGGLLWTGDRPAGVYGEIAMGDYDFGDRAQFGFSRVRSILEEEKYSIPGSILRLLGLGSNQLHEKLIYGSDFAVTRIDDLKRQKEKLGFNPAENTERVFRATRRAASLSQVRAPPRPLRCA